MSYELRFEGNAAKLTWEPEDPHGHTEYFGGAYQTVRSKEFTHYRKLHARDVYPGIDLAVYGAEGKIEYDWIVSPGGNPNNIRLSVAGGNLQIDGNGGLEIHVGENTIIQRKPVAFQWNLQGQKEPVTAEFALAGDGKIALKTGAYDRRRTLVIDPVIDSGGIFGGSGADHIVGGEGAHVIVGTTTSIDLPGEDGALHRNRDVFLYQPETDSTVIIGGSGDDVATSVAPMVLNPASSWFVVGGYTDSRDLIPKDAYRGNAVQPEYNGGASDGFFMLVQGAQPGLISYFGGSGDDQILAVSTGTANSTFAFGGATTSTDLPMRRPWQASPGGGIDGFVGSVDVTYRLNFASYLGGAGTDRVLGLAGAAALLVSGDSDSENWELPSGWTGQRQGGTDAFVLRATSGVNVATDANGMWLGGTGMDRATGLAALSSGEVMVTGVTASGDFVVPGLDPPSFLGGASDVFLARLSADLKTAQAVKLLGGSGAEEPSSLTVNSFDEVILGGWTDSTDFPMTDAVQPRYGGGASDGFLYYADSDRNVLMSSYLGGPAAEKIAYVASDVNGKIYFSGATDGSTVPFPARTKGTLSGSSHGFWGSLSLSILHVRNLSIGKDLMETVTVRLGDAENAIGLPVEVRAADPSQVLVGLEQDPSQPSLTIANGAPSWNGSWDSALRTFRAECLGSDSATTVAISAAGYPARSLTVRCVPTALVVENPQIAVSSQHSVSISVHAAALDPVSQTVVAQQAPRLGVTFPLSIESLNPGLIDFRTNSATIDSTSPATFLSGSSSGPGETDVVLTSDSGLPFVPSDRVHILVLGRRLTFNTGPLLKDTSTQVLWSYDIPAEDTPVTLRVTDPSRVLLGPSLSAPGQPSVSFVCNVVCPPVWIHVLDDSAPAGITFSAPGYDTFTTPLTFGQRAAVFVDSAGNEIHDLTLEVSQTRQVSLRLRSRSTSSFVPAYFVRPGLSQQFAHLSSSDSSVVNSESDGFWLYPGAYFGSGLFTLRAAAPGKVKFSAQIDEFNIPVEPVTITVPEPGPVADPVTVGNKLQTIIGVRVGTQSTGASAMTVTSADPARLLVSADPTVRGASSVTLAPGRRVFTVQALTDSGTAPVTMELAGMRGEVAVTLAPSGMAWTTERLEIKAPVYSPPSLTLKAYALDPATLAPLTAQVRLPGAEQVVVVSSNPSVVTADSVGSASGEQVSLHVLGSGETDLRVVQPSGFVEPLARQPAHVIVEAPTYVAAVKVGRNLQAAIALGRSSVISELPDPDELTLSSADPSKLLLSTSPIGPASPSVTITPPFPPVYAHALDADADVKLTATADGFAAGVGIAQLQRSYAVFRGYSGFSGDPNLRISAQSYLDLSVATGISSTYGLLGIQPLRSGLGPLPVEIRSSNPEVADVSAPVLLDVAAPPASFRLTPRAVGQTTLTVVPPPGFSIPPKDLGARANVTVVAPTWILPDSIVGVDLQTPVTLTLKDGDWEVPADVDVTLTSTDPALLGLGLASGDLPSASITVRIQAHQQSSRTIYLSGLAAQGSPQIRISAPGYLDSVTTVMLATATVQPPFSPMFTLPATPQDLILGLRPALGNPGQNSYAVRPGAPGYSLQLSTSDDKVFAPVSQQIDLHAGDGRIRVPLRINGPGSATLTVEGSGGFVAAAIPVTVNGGSLYLSISSAVGENLEVPGGVNSAAPGTVVTLTSTDPSKVLLAASAAEPGQASISVAQPSQGPAQFWVQALANSGPVSITASAPGYETSTTPVSLVKSLAVFLPPQLPPLLTPQSTSIALDVILKGQYQYSAQSVRPGAGPISVSIQSSDPSVGWVSPAALVFRAGESRKTATFQPLSAGFTLVSLGIPPGFGDPVAEGQQLFTVLSSKASMDVKNFAILTPVPDFVP